MARETTKPDPDYTPWTEAVAQRANVSLDVVERVLTKQGITSSGQPPRPHQLRIDHLMFSGAKRYSDGSTTPFSFELRLDHGVFVLAARGNLAGKTSVLEILMWALRGRPHRLQDDVRRWLERVEVCGAIDDEAFTVQFRLDGNRRPIGALEVRTTGANTSRTEEFYSETAFHAIMDSFMMDRLGLPAIPSSQRLPGGSEDDRMFVLYGWLAYTHAIYFPAGAYDVVLGQETSGGLAGRLLWMFLGLPWVPTLLAARVARTRYQQMTRIGRHRAQRDAQLRREEIAKLEEQLTSLRAQLAVLPPSPPEEYAALDEAMATLRQAAQVLTDAQTARDEAKQAMTMARRERLQAQRALRLREDDALAARLFRGLDPTVCPRCDAEISKKRRQREHAEHACAVCTTPIRLDAFQEPLFDPLWELRDQVDAARHAESAARQQFKAAEAALAAATQRLADAQDEVHGHTAQKGRLRQRHDLEVAIARLEGMLEQRQAVRDDAGAEHERDPGASDEGEVLKAAEAEAEDRVRAAQKSMFVDLDKEIVRLAQQFGIQELEDAQIDPGARLKVTRAGVQSWFSNLSTGEKLRVRVATVIAMLRIGQRYGIGRHPGLLILDSPGAEEAQDLDVAEMLRALHEVAEELDHLQVLAATTRGELAANVIPAERVRLVPAGEKLF